MTGRGNYNREQLAKLKEYLLAHPDGVTGTKLAAYIGVCHARAMKLLDAADQNGFLTCIDGTGREMKIFAYENAVIESIKCNFLHS